MLPPGIRSHGLKITNIKLFMGQLLCHVSTTTILSVSVYGDYIICAKKSIKNYEYMSQIPQSLSKSMK